MFHGCHRATRVYCGCPLMDTNDDPPNGNPTHHDQYTALRDEIALCQHEMHQTWLWATLAAAAVYTWLPSHRSDINTLPFPWLVWSIPPFLLIFCFFRYLVFWSRIKSLADYQYRIEEDAFWHENGSSPFSVDDIIDLPALADKLKRKQRPVDKWLAAQLSTATQEDLVADQGSSSDQERLRTSLLKDLNIAVRGSSIISNGQCFDGVNLRSKTQHLLSKKPQGDELSVPQSAADRGRIPTGVIEKQATWHRTLQPRMFG